MWSWLIILLIALCCFACFFSAVLLELKRPEAKVWIIFTCVMVFAVVGTLLSVPSPAAKEYSYELKPAKIELKYFEPIEKLPEQNEPQNKTSDDEKRVSVMVNELNVRLEPQYSAESISSVQYGQILTILEGSENLDWVKVRINDGSIGWVAKKYVKEVTF